MLVLDSDVFLYATGGEHPLREPARALVDAAGSGRFAVTTTPLVVQEVAHVRARRQSRTAALAVAAAAVRLCDPLLPVSGVDADLALRLYADDDRLDAFDALLAATTMRSGAAGLVSADRAFATVPGLAHHDLATLDVTILAG